MIMNVCLATDNNYARHCGVTIASILDNKADSDQLHFYVFNNNLSPANMDRLLNLKRIKPCSIEFIKIAHEQTALFPLLKSKNISRATWLRISIASNLCYLGKGLYLDSDLIIMESLASLYDTDISDFYGAMVIDGPAQKMEKVLGMTNSYYNAGVLLINCVRWREDGLESKMLQWALCNSELMLYADQDAINSITDGKIKTIDPRYNTFEEVYNKGAFDLKPVIIHLVGRQKPWNPMSRRPSSVEYFKYLSLTDWSRDKYFYFLRMLLKIVAECTINFLKMILHKISPSLFMRVKKIYFGGYEK